MTRTTAWRLACAAALLVSGCAAPCPKCPPCVSTIVLRDPPAPCTVVELEHDSGVTEALCLSATDLEAAYAARAGRKDQ